MRQEALKAVKDKPLITDHELVGELLMVSAITKALAKSVVMRRTNNKNAKLHNRQKSFNKWED